MDDEKRTNMKTLQVLMSFDACLNRIFLTNTQGVAVEKKRWK
jgi:hypothetical protein